MKKNTIILLICITLLALMFSSCNLPSRNMPSAVLTQNKTVHTNSPVTATQQVFDYAIVLSDGAKNVPPLIHLSQDIESIFFVTNNRTTDSVFEIPQLNIYEKLSPAESTFISVIPVKNGFYQMSLNSASYGTFQVK